MKDPKLVVIQQKTQENQFTKLSVWEPKDIPEIHFEAIDKIKKVNYLTDYKLLYVISHKWCILYVFRKQNWFQKLFNL